MTRIFDDDEDEDRSGSQDEIIERFLQGTNQGRFQTIRFQLRYLGRFGSDERSILWDNDYLTAGVVLPGTEITVYLGDVEFKPIVVLGMPTEEDILVEDLYIVHTVKEGSAILDNLRTYIDYLRMKWRIKHASV
ncbi:MAG TPA: hypothetical protein PL124_10460 [Candidatus Cloacimonadota bacterium]|nr:hypothetical protein [Candidatus Cloacimonadota bacterium]